MSWTTFQFQFLEFARRKPAKLLFFSADVQFPLNALQEPNNSGSPITDYTLEHDDG